MKKSGKPKSFQGIEAILQSHKSELQQKFGVTTIGVFGSYVKHNPKKSSDIDILIEFKGRMGFVKFMKLEKYLAELLSAKVDLVTKDALKPFIGQHILSEVRYV